MKGCWVECWHPDSPGTRLRVWRPWWRRKSRPFATWGEVDRAWVWAMPWHARWVPGGEVRNVTGRPSPLDT